MSRAPAPMLLAIFAAVLWGTTGTAQALGATGAPPAAVGAARIIVGGLILGAVAAGRMGPAWAGRVARGHPRAVAVAVVAIAVYQVAFFSAVARTGVAVGTLVAIGSAPIMTGAIAAVAEGERPGRHWFVATFLAVSGTALLLWPTELTRVDAAGLLFAMGAGLSYAAYTVAAKRLLDTGLPPVPLIGVLFAGAALLLTSVLVVAGAGQLVTARGLVMAAWLGVFATALAYVLYAHGLRRLTASTVGTLTLAEPLTAAILGAVVLHERPGVVAIAGAALILLGLLVLTVGLARDT